MFIRRVFFTVVWFNFFRFSLFFRFILGCVFAVKYICSVFRWVGGRVRFVFLGRFLRGRMMGVSGGRD